MGTIPIPEVLPFIELAVEVESLGIDCRPELIEIGAMRALHLAVEVRRPWPDRAELDPQAIRRRWTASAKNSRPRSV